MPTQSRIARQLIARPPPNPPAQIVAAAPRAVLHESFWRRRTPLMAASKRGDLLTVTSLLWAAERALGPEFPGYVNAVDLAGAGALLLAVRAGHAPVVRALLGAGATPLPADRHGNTTLHVAAAKGHAACAALLLDARVREAGGRQVAAAQAMVRGAAGEQRYIDAHNQYGA
jgi:ankyrin repeat protein